MKISTGGFELRSSEVYNIKSDTYRRVSDMPFALHRTCGVRSTADQKIFLIGGYIKSYKIKSDKTLAYDIESSTFTLLEGKMKNTRAKLACQIYGRKILAAGGVKCTDAKKKTSVEMYDIDVGTWRMVQPIPDMKSTPLVWENDMIAVRRGHPPIIHVYNEQQDKWKAFMSLIHPRQKTKTWVPTGSIVVQAKEIQKSCK